MNFEMPMSESESLIREVVESGGEFRLYPKGTSMLPLIHQGKDSVILTRIKENIKVGDVPLYKRGDGQYVLHRIVRKEKDGTYTMCGDNQTALEKGIKKEQMIAVVSAICHGEKRVDTNKFSYKCYCFLWRSFFVRKVYFKLRKLIRGKKQ